MRITTTVSEVTAPDSARKSITIRWITENQDLTDLIKTIPSGDVAFICNTVGNAQRLHKAIKQLRPDAETILGHSRYTVQDRLRLDNEILKRFGSAKTQHLNQLRIVVGTQTLEQSLDVDFDLMVTELAPIDLVLQRAGRLHRHTRHRPAAYQTPQLIILNHLDGIVKSHHSHMIYSPYDLYTTQKVLEATPALVLPKDLEHLIETTLHYAEDTKEYAELQANHVGHIENKLQAAQLAVWSVDPEHQSKPVFNTLEIDHTIETPFSGVRDGISGPNVTIIYMNYDGIMGVYTPNHTFHPLTINQPIPWQETQHIQASQITLPLHNLQDVPEMEQSAPYEVVQTWKDNPMLKGELPILFQQITDTQYTCNIAGLCYSHTEGLFREL